MTGPLENFARKKTKRPPPPRRGKAPTTVEGPLCTDLGNARRIVLAHGQDLRWTVAHGWLVWDGTRWAIDRAQEVERRAKDAVERIFEEANVARRAGNNDLANALWKWAMQSQAARNIRNALTLAESERSIAMMPEAFDRDPWLLNVRNGTIDLRTGALRPHRREDLLTKVAGCIYDPEASPPARWLRFLETSVPDPDVREFLRRFVGYSLTGRIDEECFVFFYGEGSNGKSTFTETVQALLGDYTRTTSFDVFLPRERGQATNDLARLAGARMVLASEPEESASLSESVVKLVTGGDRISCRYLHKEFFEYVPEFKIFMLGNHKPRIRGTDHGIWRRVRLVPWTTKVTEPDTSLKGEQGVLRREELPGILRWAVEGCLAWQKDGLRVPSAILAATETYRQEQDDVETFLGDRCRVGASEWVTAKTLRLAYMDWCTETGEKPMSQKAMGRRLTERGYVRERYGGKHRWVGFAVTHVTHSDPSPPISLAYNSMEEKCGTKGLNGSHGSQGAQQQLHLDRPREPGEDG